MEQHDAQENAKQADAKLVCLICAKIQIVPRAACATAKFVLMAFIVDIVNKSTITRVFHPRNVGSATQ